MKKNKLYTANRWNQPAFMPDRVGHNIFDGFTLGQSQQMNINPFGVRPLTAPQLSPYNSWMSPLQKAEASYQMQNPGAATIQAAANTAMQHFGQNAVSNPLSFKQAFSTEGIKGGLKAGAGAAIGGIANAIGGLAGSAISDGYDAGGVGNSIGSIGGTVGSAVGAVNPLLGAAVSVGSQLIGGLTNRAFGTKTDQKKLAQAQSDISSLSNFNGNEGSFDGIQGPAATASVAGTYKGGWFAKGKARKKQRELEGRLLDARQFADRSITNNVENLADEQLTDALANFAAFGGEMDTGNGAIDYGFMNDYLTMKKRRDMAKEKLSLPAVFGRGGGLFEAEPQSTLFALGGDMQTNGADWTTGLTRIDAGKSHEENPNDGVQVGVDQEGTPNLVEEGETIFNDYVYSARINCDEQTKKFFHLPKKKDITYAELSKKLEKEASERPNDPISQAGLQAQLSDLAEQQERQKQEMEAERARQAFEALSPDEQAAVMQEVSARQNLAAQEQMEEVQQPSQEETLLTQQQTQADGSEARIGQEPQMGAFGGKINRFDLGGNILKSLRINTLSDFKKWAKENKAASEGFDWDIYQSTDDIPWRDLIQTPTFRAALSKDNPALADALDKGYDFGTYQPGSTGKATIQSISRGNWKATDGKGWRGSDDLAFKQATEGLTDGQIDALTTEQLAERMKNTDAYQNTNKWLQNSDNALLYLNTLMNDPDTPEVAREYARKFVQDGKWKEDFDYDYATVFGSNGNGVRETNPGTYWHSVQEANRGSQAGNLVINEDGTVEPIIGDVPTDWTSAGSYAWATPENDVTYNYYRRPVATAPVEKPQDTVTDGDEDNSNRKNNGQEPIDRWENLRYAGLFGPVVGLGLQMAGVGRPDTASLDAAIEGSGDVRKARYKPLGNYLTYRPMDIWYEQNRLNANARATDRSILNASNGNAGTAMAGLLANGYSDQIASGNLYRQALEYNDNLRKQVAEFNRGTDQFNADAYNRTSQFNADARNRARQANAQLRMQAAAQKADMDAGWYNGIYGNLSGLFKGIADIGTENYRMNRIAEMGADGIFGNLGTSNIGRKIIRNKKRSTGRKD